MATDWLATLFGTAASLAATGKPDPTAWFRPAQSVRDRCRASRSIHIAIGPLLPHLVTLRDGTRTCLILLLLKRWSWLGCRLPVRQAEACLNTFTGVYDMVNELRLRQLLVEKTERGAAGRIRV